MAVKRKICIITGTRAEYGQLSLLIKLVNEDPDLDLQLIATGAHLSETHGYTCREIEADGFVVDRKIDIDLRGDSPEDVARSMSIALISFAAVFKKNKPDILVLLGDRYEIFAVASAALLFGIPIAHIGGGASTEGAIDEAFRHSISKMSHLHFACAEKERKKIIQLGESPERVFNFGEPAVDIIKNVSLMDRDEFEESIGRKLKAKNLLVTFHPATLDPDDAGEQFSSLLQALDKLDDTLFIFTNPNADPGSGKISGLLSDYVLQNPEKALSFISMGQRRYLSALKFVDAVVGNSSSGLAEAPSFKIGTVNIGSRQDGRIKAESIIDCEPNLESISVALGKIYSDPFQAVLKNVKNPYGEGGASKKIKKVLKTFDLVGIKNKTFFDIDFEIPGD
jgi:GDP/UDP-N,N'-diacetylbacillosamine 2-epimerase (hydrolysing)